MPTWSPTFILVWIVCHIWTLYSINVTRPKKKNVTILWTCRQIKLLVLMKHFDETIRLTTFVHTSCTFCICLIIRVSKNRNKMYLNLFQIISLWFFWKVINLSKTHWTLMKSLKKNNETDMSFGFFSKYYNFFQINCSKNLFLISFLNQIATQNFKNDFVIMIVFV